MFTDRRFLQDAQARAVDQADPNVVEISFSSEYDEGQRWYGIEILSHAPGAMRMGRLEQGAAVLLEHDTARHVGVTSSPRIEAGRGYLRTRFGSDPDSQRAMLQVNERIKKDVSVAYSVLRIVEETQRADGSINKRELPVEVFDTARRALEQDQRCNRDLFLREIDRVCGPFDRSHAKGVPTFRVELWEPYEVSFVAVPFDPTVGLDRSMAAAATPAQPFKENPVSDTTTAAPAAPQPDITNIRAEAQRAERDRTVAIRAMGQAHSMVDEADAAVRDGIGLDQFRQTVLDKLVAAGKLKPAVDNPAIGMTEGDKRQFSVVRLMAALLDPMDAAAQRAAGFEMECSAAARKLRPLDPSAEQYRARENGATIPFDVLASPLALERGAAAQTAEMLMRLMAQRDLNVGTTTAGGNLVATNLLAGNFIDLLRNRIVVAGLGARMLDGLVGNLAIPSQSAGAATYWVTEGNAVTESEATFGQVTMSPKTVGMFTDYTRRTLLQTTPAIEALVRADLASGIAVEIDRAAIAGSGGSGQPRGVINTAGIGSVPGGANGAAPTYPNMIALEEQVAIANADAGAMSFLTNARMRAQLRGTQQFASTNGVPVWGSDNTVLGYGAAVSNNVPNTLTKGSSSGVCSAIVFGNWSDVLIGMWGGLDLILDTSVLATSGGRRLVALQDVDVAVRRAASFAAMLDALRV